MNTQRVKYPVTGRQPELRGQFFDVPTSVIKKAEWIESQYQEALLKDAADTARAEAESVARDREAQVLRDRIARQSETENALSARLQALEDKLAKEPNLALALTALNDSAAVIDRHHALAVEARALQAELTATLVEAQNLSAAAATQIAEASQLKDETLQLLKTNRDISNEAFASYAKQLQNHRAELNNSEYDLRNYRQLMDEHKETVANAAAITDEVREVAVSVAAEAVQQQKDEIFAFANVLMRVLGVDANMARQALNASNVTGRNVMNRGEFDMLVSTFQRANEGFNQQEAATNAAARSARELAGG